MSPSYLANLREMYVRVNAKEGLALEVAMFDYLKTIALVEGRFQNDKSERTFQESKFPWSLSTLNCLT